MNTNVLIFFVLKKNNYNHLRGFKQKHWEASAPSGTDTPLFNVI